MTTLTVRQMPVVVVPADATVDMARVHRLLRGSIAALDPDECIEAERDASTGEELSLFREAEDAKPKARSRRTQSRSTRGGAKRWH